MKPKERLNMFIPKKRLKLEDHEIDYRNYEMFKKEYKDAEKTNMGYRSTSGRTNVMSISFPSCEDFPEFDSPELEKFFQTSGRSSNDLKILENAIRKHPILLGDRRIMYTICYYSSLLDGAFKWRRKDNVHLWKGGYKYYRKFLDAVSRGIIPKDSQGRYKKSGEIDNEVIKKEYEKLVDKLEKLFQKKKYKEYIKDKKTPTSKHLKITNLARLHDILKEFPSSEKYNSDIFDELKQRIKQRQELEQSYKSCRITKYATKRKVEEKLQTKFYPINTNKALAKHILSIKYNKGYPAIDKIV